MPDQITPAYLAENGPVEISPDLFVYKQRPISKPLVGDQISNLQEEADQVVSEIPHTGMGFLIMRDGFLDDAIRAFDLWRLRNICQLGYLEDPDTQTYALPIAGRFTHTRFSHSLDTMALASMVAHNNLEWFKDKPGHKAVLVLAALTHDVLTPAGGDTTKSIDFKAFDEDVHYKEVLELEDVQAFCKMHNVDTSLLIKTIHGKGVLGSILDIVDKIAYVSRDLLNFEGSSPNRKHKWGDKSPMRNELTKWTTQPNLTGVWSSIHVDNSGVVITDDRKLEKFLSARALLFKNLYKNPYARHHESLMMFTLISFLYETGRITRDKLIKMDDEELGRLITGMLNEELSSVLLYQKTSHRIFETISEANTFMKTRVLNGGLFAQTEDVGSFFKPGTHFRVQTKDGPQPFKDAYPERAKKILELGSSVGPIRVYFFEGTQPQLKDSLQEKFKQWRKTKAAKT